ncbi:hypothetical protein AJ80_00891 [Polytolypa hystricis UAMH7299]|uniref:Phosphotransferase n=1 Tax=Polytolypa hystricis (strain UAMH7299) TaxID=1447883 RepID=A0A2B7Z2G6_POLH7|nr:hypothetical protein AJ80_00891 [Polytolypa hystricis UAMH7299]
MKEPVSLRGIRRKKDEADEKLQSFLQPLRLDDETLYNLAYLSSTIYKDHAINSLQQFFPTPITHLPTGRETGTYLAVYMGPSYLRVAFIELLGGDSETHHNAERQPVKRVLEKAFFIERHLKRDHAEDLFAWIGDCIAEVVRDRLDSDIEAKKDIPSALEIGVSFCFPIKQNSPEEAILMPTGKGFAINSDLNLRQALLDGYERHTRRSSEDAGPSATKRQKRYALPKLKISVMINDTVATLASLAYSVHSLPNSRVVMGLIVGSGCNATVPMRLTDLHQSKTRHLYKHNPHAVEALVSTEWTLSDLTPPLKQGNIVTQWDMALDANCDRPGFQPLEYVTGGRYIGELVRVITYDYMTRILEISPHSLPEKLANEDGIATEFLSHVVAPSRPVEDFVADLSQRLPPPASSNWTWTAATAGILRSVASAVQSRSASLVASAAVGLLACTGEIQLANRPQTGGSPLPSSQRRRGGGEVATSHANWLSGPEELVIAFSGGVIQHYPGYKETVQRYVDRLIMRGGPQEGGKSIFLREASDGGIVGVGVLAGTVSGRIKGIIGSGLEFREKEVKFSQPLSASATVVA